MLLLPRTLSCGTRLAGALLPLVLGCTAPLDHVVQVHYSEVAVCSDIVGTQSKASSRANFLLVFKLGAIENQAAGAVTFSLGSGQFLYSDGAGKGPATPTPAGTTRATTASVPAHTTRPGANEKFFELSFGELPDVVNDDHLLTFESQGDQSVVLVRDPYAKQDFSRAFCGAALLEAL